MVHTQSKSVSDTYTEARAREVMGKVYEDLINLMNTGLISKSYADEIRRDILYLLSKRALLFFELQFKLDEEEIGGLHYEVKDDSTISLNDDSGDIDFWGLDKNTSVSLFIKKKLSCPCLAEVNAQLRAWGWGAGSALTGEHVYSKSYSKEGFGVKQSIIGKW